MEDSSNDGGRNSRGNRKFFSRLRARNGGALARRRENRERNKLSGKDPAVRRRRILTAQAVRLDVRDSIPSGSNPKLNL